MSGSKRDQRRNQVIGQGFGVQTVPSASLDELDMALFGDIPELTGSAITRLPNGEVQIGNFTLTARGLMTADGATHEEWDSIGQVLRRLDRSLQWLLGDWLVMGKTIYGETYEQIAQLTGYKVRTLYNYAYVAEHVEFYLRKENLTFGHHNLVAGLNPEHQEYWLSAASAGNWSVARLRKAMSQEYDNTGGHDTPLIAAVKSAQAKALKLLGNAPLEERKEAANMLRVFAQRLEDGK